MRRLAIFVEGYTEVLFIERLVREIAGAHRVSLDVVAIRGGASCPRTIKVLRTADVPSSGSQHYVLIVDCGGDHLVAQRVREEHEGLTTKGYEKILALRDVRPEVERDDIPRLERGLRLYIKTSLIPVHFFLAIMEFEAWLISEETHFERIAAGITVDRIRAELGFDPRDDMSLRDNPARDIADAYLLGSEVYSKPAEPTIAALDIDRVYLEMPAKIPYLSSLINELDAFFV